MNPDYSARSNSKRGSALRVLSALAVALVLSVAVATGALCQAVGDRVVLESENPLGVPVHPAAGDARFVRWANSTRGSITAFDGPSGWYQVSATGTTGWVTRRYIRILEEPPEEEETDELPTHVVGTWNIEWLSDGHSRGFPENTHGGPTYPPRADAEYAALADIIATQLAARLLVLTEIGGRPTGGSDELDRLLTHLGQGWAYEIGTSGRDQRVAMLWNQAAMRLDHCVEFAVAREVIDDSDVFARDPLACLFTMLGPDATAQNDFIVVGLHLASGQAKAANHNKAMRIVRDSLARARADGRFPACENDVLLAGDLNASRYDGFIENFWENFDASGLAFRTLSPPIGIDYPGTRLVGVPLTPRSQIDYLIASGVTGGLVADVVQPVAHVHLELLPADFTEFRRRASDHIPVTVRLRVRPDDDAC